eukprot:195504-Rhodomonas_salina.1
MGQCGKQVRESWDLFGWASARVVCRWGVRWTEAEGGGGGRCGGARARVSHFFGGKVSAPACPCAHALSHAGR